MDPASAGGLAIGVVSLAFDVFDNTVKLFRFLSSMVEMPKDCEQCRLRLLIEYNRLLAWGKAVGLIDVPKDKDVAVTLGTNAVELCGIISRIGWLLGEFKDINARWKNELNPYDHEAAHTEATYKETLQGLSALEIAYDKTQDDRRYIRGTNHIIRWMAKRVDDAREIVANPSRVRWVMVDKYAFEALLNDLHNLIERLHELMGDFHQKRIDEITADTYRQLVLVRNDVNELRDMLDAVTTFLQHSKTPGGTRDCLDQDKDEEFRGLLILKKVNRLSHDVIIELENGGTPEAEKALQQLIKVEKFNGDKFQDFKYSKVDDALDPSKLARASGS